jgi:hypothetical protein
MKSRRSRVPKKPNLYVFTNKGPDGSKVEAALKPIRDNGGSISKKVYIKIYVGNWKADLPKAHRIIRNPRLRSNNWKYFVETLIIDGEEYFRLVNSIPLVVMRKWKRTGNPPKVSVNWGGDTREGPGKHLPHGRRKTVKVSRKRDTAALAEAEEARRLEERMRRLVDETTPGSETS